MQTSAGKAAVSAKGETPVKPGADDSAAGGLDWLQSLAPPKAHAAAVPASTGEPPPGSAPEKVAAEVAVAAAAEDVDWLGAALKGNIPANPTVVPSAKEMPSTQEEGGRGNSAEGDDWLAVATSSGQAKRKSPPGPSARPLVAAAPATQGGWMSAGKLGLPTGDDSDEDGAGKIGGGGSTAVAVATPKKKKKTGPSSPTAGGPGGWLGSGALGVPVEDDNDEDSRDGGGGDDSGRGAAVTIETQTEDDIGAVTERGAVEKGDAPKLPPWAKPWTPPPKPEVVPDAKPEEASAPSGGAAKEVI